MDKKIFIQTNNKQYLGALISKYSIEKHLSDKTIPVEIMNVDNHPSFKNFVGKMYLRKGVMTRYDPNDLQSFTLSRFMPPELMHFQGRALVVDPDVFALVDVAPLLSMDMEGQAIACCAKDGRFETSVMLLDCAKLTSWKIDDFFHKLEKGELDYNNIINLHIEKRIKAIPRTWNDLNTLTPETKMIHMTERLTQPWKTGLPIDFTRMPLPKIFGVFPREPLYRLLGRYPNTYQPHPNKHIEKLFLDLVKEALHAKVITEAYLKSEVAKKHIRQDIFNYIS
ncbi:MAG: hypothetical protein RLZZ347_463 [Candidatus Parcubacteria bacterium]|jgi:hypothetical protein